MTLYEQAQQDSFEEYDISKLINSNNFSTKLKEVETEKLGEVLGIIDEMRTKYSTDNVPSAKEQIAILDKKEVQCMEEISERMANEKPEYEGKGKGVDRGENNSDNKVK